MSIIARHDAPIEPSVSGAPTGLTGTIGVRIEDGQGGTTLPRQTTGIIESPAGSGVYTATLTAPSAAGTYLIVWDTGNTNTAWSAEDLTVRTTYDPDLITTEVTPAPSEIGAINRARTDDGRGDTLGTFTTDTRPTLEDVEILASLAAGQVADKLGNTIPGEFTERARGAAALYGAVLVESSTRDPRTTLIKAWTDMADLRVKQLAVEIAEVGAGNQEGPGDDQLGPVYAFPAVCPLPTVF